LLKLPRLRPGLPVISFLRTSLRLVSIEAMSSIQPRQLIVLQYGFRRHRVLRALAFGEGTTTWSPDLDRERRTAREEVERAAPCNVPIELFKPTAALELDKMVSVLAMRASLTSSFGEGTDHEQACDRGRRAGVGPVWRRRLHLVENARAGL
jgi:hypothetical protein